MKTIEFLQRRNDPEKGLEELKKYYGIEHVINKDKTLVILNYSQIESPKTNDLVQETRGLILEYGTWKVVARSFRRFFNYGENIEATKDFNWNNFVCQSKEDGSLVTLFYYDGAWRIATRGSFAEGKVNNSDKTWTDLFTEALSRERIKAMGRWGVIYSNYSYVFELCSPYNKVVRRYDNTTLFLLTVVDNVTGQEYSLEDADEIALIMNVKRPDTHKINNYADIEKFLSEHPDATFEGFVVCDNNNVRLKVKNPKYVALHRMRGNGDDIFNPKNLIPFILKGEEDELTAYFPETKPYLNKYRRWLEKEFRKIDLLWTKVENIKSQKEFALAIAESEWTAILFRARKEGVHPKEIWGQSDDLLIKRLKDKNVEAS